MRTDGKSSPAPLRPLPGGAERLPAGEAPVSRAAAAAERRSRILAATAELVAKRGYHDTTVELIVRRAHVGRPAFQREFPDKEAAFLAVFDETVARTARLVAESVAARTGEAWPAQVAVALRALFDEIAARPLLARACLVEVLTAGPVAVERYERALRGLRPIFARGRELVAGGAELADGLEDTLIGGVAWIVYQRLVAGEADRLLEFLPDTLEFVLLPYLGEEGTAQALSKST